GVSDDAFVVLQVARLDALKDHPTAVRAFERVVRDRPDAVLVLIGEGPEAPAIREEVRRRGLEEHVRFLGLQTDVEDLLPGSDLFLLTSISEGIPVTLIEAMGAAIPVVATGVGGVGEVVDDGVTGLLSTSGDDARLAEQILRLAREPEARERMGRAGRDR